MSEIGAQLYQSVSDINVHTVEHCLLEGADPNYVDPYFVKNGVIEEGQPHTPLRLCVFSFSSCTLTNKHLTRIIKIARLLIEHGAVKKPALDYYHERYGDPAEPLSDDDESNHPDIWDEFYDLLS